MGVDCEGDVVEVIVDVEDFGEVEVVVVWCWFGKEWEFVVVLVEVV